MAGMDRPQLHAASPHPLHATVNHGGHVHAGHVHSHSTLHPGRPIKYRPGISILACIETIVGLMVMTFEAISVVMYRASKKEYLHGMEYAGIFVGIFAMTTGVVGIIAGRKHSLTGLRRLCFAMDIALTIFLALQVFSMACISAAMLILILSWDSVLAAINRLSQSVDLNFVVATTTTVSPSVTLSDSSEIQLRQDFNLLVGLRCMLFLLYFFLLVASVVSSCFGCCNCCKCWISPPATPGASEAQLATVSGVVHTHPNIHGSLHEKKPASGRDHGVQNSHAKAAVTPKQAEGVAQKPASLPKASKS